MTNTEKMLNQIDDLVINEADQDVVDPRRLVTSEITLSYAKELLKKEVALRLAYTTIRGLNNKWYAKYSNDTAYIQTLKDQLRACR
jgi:hypothetical protein